MAKRAMDSKTASMKKTSGHKNEEHFADAIDGDCKVGASTGKPDVIDKNGQVYSVKAGKLWQIFLYRKERLKTNTEFQNIGNVAKIMVDCLNAFPPSFEEYQADKETAKEALRPNMRALLAEFQQPSIFEEFLYKAIFNSRVDLLAIYPGKANDPQNKKHFHVFHKDDVIKALCSDLTLANSRKIKTKDTPEQKVVLQSKLARKQAGQIELRNDSQQHYKEMKFRLEAEVIAQILLNSIKPSKQLKPNVTVYGKATRLMKS